MDNIIVTFEDGTKKEYQRGIKLADVVEDMLVNQEIICGKFNNEIINLHDRLTRNGKLFLYSINTGIGSRMYEKGLTLLFKVSAMEVLGKKTDIKIRYSIDRGVFFEVDKEVSNDDMLAIKKLMKEKISKGIPFEKIETSKEEALEYFAQIDREDKVKTLFYDEDNYVTLYKFDGVYNYIIGDLPDNTSILKQFDLTFFFLRLIL